jgi:alkanesulfonate monooxygenase SsuD/methylene tetrahydromethanopterin reductase-like flavin-dependent oxidoreductase (luciferase family)
MGQTASANFTSMRVSTVVLPIYEGGELLTVWRRAEALGFHAGYTYDHLTWQSFRDRPWFAAVPTLAAAASATERLRIGTLVTSPNFRHPVTLAKELMTLDHLSGGRLTAGIGSGGTGFDATALGQDPWSPSQRADRLDEFVRLLDRLLTHRSTTSEGHHYSAVEARTIPECVQRPRVPFLIAATGPRGMALAAEFGQGWVTYGDPAGPAARTPAEARQVVVTQMEQLESACARAGRPYETMDRVLLQGLTSERPLDSLDAFVDWAGSYREVGITEVVIHWPVPDSVFASDPDVFERIAVWGRSQLG